MRTAHPSTEATAGAASRQAILETAARLFREQGYAATSLRTLAQACAMQPASLYYHFSSKDQIVAEVLDMGVQRVFDAVREAVQALPPDADADLTLYGAIEAHLRGLLQLHDFTSANIRIYGQVPEHVRAGHRALRRRYERYWFELLCALRDRGQLRADCDLRRTVFFLFGAMNWTTEWYDARKSSLAAVAADLARLALHGLQPGSAQA